MSTHIKYVHRIANSAGVLPTDRIAVELGGNLAADTMLVQVAPNPDSKGDLILTIDSIHSPQDFADFMATALHGMTGAVEGITCELVPLIEPEPSGLIQDAPAGVDVIDGDIVEEAEAK